MAQVEVHGPDGNDYQFPDGTTKDQAIAYFKKKGIGAQATPASAAGTGQGAFGAVSSTPQDMRFGSYDPLNPTFLEKIGAGMGLGPEHIAKAEDIWGRFAGGAGLPQQVASDKGFGADVAQGAKQMFTPEASKEHPGFGQTIPILGTAFRQQRETYDQPGAWGKVYGSIPFVGPQGYQMGKDIESKNYAGAFGDAANILLQFLGGKMAPEAAAGMPATAETAVRTLKELRPGLDEASHAVLSNAASKVKQTVGQGGPIHRAISDHYQRLTNDVIAADYASGKKIPINDIWEEALKHADDYAAGKATPKFNAIVQDIQNRPTELTWKELHDVQKNIDKAASTATEGSRDAGAVTSIRKSIADKLNAKAEEVGQGQKWDAAKTIWRTLKEYQDEGVLNRLLKTGGDPVSPGAVGEGGKQFFDVLTDKANQPKLREINKGFESYGLPANYFQNIVAQHAPLHDFLNVQEGSMSRLQLLRKHPAAALPGMVVGGGIGAASHIPAASFVGGTVGAAAGVKGAAKLRAAAAMERLGGRPEVSSPLTEAAKVEAVNTGQTPAPPAAAAGAVSMDELTDALKSLGYKKADAANLARQGISEHPNDFNAALKRAMQGPSAASKAADLQKVKSVSGGSQAADRGTYAADPRTHEQILDGLQELKKSGQGKIKTQAQIEAEAAEAMSPKSMKNHQDAYMAAKEEWMKANPGKDPANHMSEIARRADELWKGK